MFGGSRQPAAPEAAMYRIGDFSRLAQVSVKALRFYDEIGLLRPAWTDPRSGYRYYAAEQLADLNRVTELKELGLSLAEVVSVGDGRLPADRLRETLLRKKAEAERGLEAARGRLDRIEASLARLGPDDPPPRFSVVTKTVPSRLVVSRRGGGVDAMFESLDEIDRHVRRHRARGQRAAAFYGCDAASGELDCEALSIVDGAVPATERLRVYEMPAVRVASVVHAGALAGVSDAYAALTAWVQDNGLELAGSCLEVYLRGKVFEGESVVEIQFPLRAGAARVVH